MSREKLVYIANAKGIPVAEAKGFVYPTGDQAGTARPGLLLHIDDGFVAYDGLCTHMGAEVNWNKETAKIWCTMHDGMYDPKTGRPFMGLPKTPLRKIELKIEENGDIYAVL